MRVLKTLLVVAGFSFAAVAPAVPALADDPGGLPTVEFTGTMIVSNPKGEQLDFAVIYTPDRMRFDMTFAGQKMAVITDRKEQKIFMLFPAQKGYAERPFDPSRDMMANTLPPDRKFEKVGDETIDGHETSKYKVTGRTDEDRAFDGHVWLTADRIMMRMEGEIEGDGGEKQPVRIEMKNLKIAEVDRARLQLPEDYKPMKLGEGER